MRRKLTLTTLLVLAIGVLGAGLPVAFAGGGSRGETLRWRIPPPGQEDYFAELDAGDPGPSVGDEFYVTAPMLQRGKRIGRVNFFCEQFSDSQIYCQLEHKVFGKGKFLLEGLVNVPPETIKYAIVGGTGKYKDARGQVTIDAATGKAVAKFV